MVLRLCLFASLVSFFFPDPFLNLVLSLIPVLVLALALVLVLGLLQSHLVTFGRAPNWSLLFGNLAELTQSLTHLCHVAT